MDIFWLLVFIHYITFKLKNMYFFSFLLLFVLIWCQSGEILVGQADFSSPPDRLSIKVWETFVNSGHAYCHMIYIQAISQCYNI